MQLEQKSREHLIKEVARTAAKEAVYEMMLTIGVDSKNPKEIQADLIYLNRLRKGVEYVNMRIKAVMVAVIVPSILMLIWNSIRS